MSKLMTNEYARLLAEVKERVRAAQYAAFRAVNKELVVLYWDIGRMISKRQVTGMHGDAVVEQLASDLRMEFPGVGGFSRRNVFYMREFYIAYRDLPKVQPLVAIITRAGGNRQAFKGWGMNRRLPQGPEGCSSNPLGPLKGEGVRDL